MRRILFAVLVIAGICVLLSYTLSTLLGIGSVPGQTMVISPAYFYYLP